MSGLHPGPSWSGEGDGFRRQPFETVVDMFWDAVDRAPDRIALIQDERRITYRHYGVAAAQLASRLAEIDVDGERAAIILPNSIEANIATFGSLSAGAQVTMLNPAYSQTELAPLLAISKPKIILACAQNEAVVRAAAAAAGIAHVWIIGQGDFALDALIIADRARPRIAIKPESPAALFFTGGTTGVPKGVDRSHHKLSLAVDGMHRAWPTPVDDAIWLNVAPVSHVWGAMMGLFNPVYGRSTLVIVPRFQPDRVLAAIQEHQVSVFSGGPAAIYAGLLAMPNIDKVDLSSLRICPGGGSPFLMETLIAWEARTGIPILEAFGMTEGGPISANPVDGGHRYGTVGRAQTGIDVSIVALDDPEREVAVGEVGEVRIRGEMVVHEYRGQEPGRADGWLYTGDVGVFDADGFLRLVDRTKDMLIVGGFNVYPREIEEVLAQHPDVTEAAVVGIPDERSGEVPVAYVMLRSTASATAEDLETHCVERLVRYRRPKWVEIVNSIPKTPANKTCRRTLVLMARNATTRSDEQKENKV